MIRHLFYTLLVISVFLFPLTALSQVVEVRMGIDGMT